MVDIDVESVIVAVMPPLEIRSSSVLVAKVVPKPIVSSEPKSVSFVKIFIAVLVSSDGRSIGSFPKSTPL
jgi:hypothetical protein